MSDVTLFLASLMVGVLLSVPVAAVITLVEDRLSLRRRK